MQSKAKNVTQYLNELPAERRSAIAAVRKAILDNLDAEYEEGMAYGMISFHVPLSVYPPGYHCNPKMGLPFAGLASQKNYMSLYLTSVYADPKEEDWLRKRFAAAGKKLDMGKCCVRFKRLDDLPLEVIGEAIRRVPAREHIAFYERALQKTTRRPASAKAGGKAGRPSASAKKKRSTAAGTARKGKKATSRRAAR